MAKPNVGKVGSPSNDQPGGTQGNLKSLESSHGPRWPFLPKSYDGAREESGSAGTTLSSSETKMPFLPDKPE